MTPEEKQLIDTLGDVYRQFVDLCTRDPDSSHYEDIHEFRNYVHILQRAILAREGRRSLRQFPEGIDPQLINNSVTQR